MRAAPRVVCTAGSCCTGARIFAAPRPGEMEENCQVRVASKIYSINILVQGNVKLGGKKSVIQYPDSTLHRLPLCRKLLPGIQLKYKMWFKVISCPLSSNLHYSAETPEKIVICVTWWVYSADLSFPSDTSYLAVLASLIPKSDI